MEGSQAEREGRSATAAAPARERTGAPGAAELLRAALEKIVFFEWRLSELSAELAAAHTRTAAAEGDRRRAHDEAQKSAHEAQEARRHSIELESEQARLSSLLARPAHAPAIDEAALFAERDRTAQLSAELVEARREIARQKDERSRWLQEMIEQARQGDEAPAALAQFISELRGEVISLRDRQRRGDALLIEAGIAPPQPATPLPPTPHPLYEHDAVVQARKLLAEGRIGSVDSPSIVAPSIGAASIAAASIAATNSISPSGSAAQLTKPAAPIPTATDLLPGLAALQRSPAPVAVLPPVRPISSAQRALVEQCLRGLTSTDAARRAQAARHLAALPLPAAAPGLAAALGRETDPRARAAIARALASCGGDGAAALIAQLQSANEPALVRLAALDALAGMGPVHARAALETGALDHTPALRRRAASLSLASGENGDLVARLSVDPDASVRSAAGGEGSVPEAPLAEEEFAGEPPPAPLPTLIDLPADRSLSSASPLRPAPRELVGVQINSAAAHPAVRAAAHIASAASPRDAKLGREALFAVRTAIMGLTESDLASILGIDFAATESLVKGLVAEGVLSRRGRRLIVGSAGDGEGANASANERGA